MSKKTKQDKNDTEKKIIKWFKARATVLRHLADMADRMAENKDRIAENKDGNISDIVIEQAKFEAADLRRRARNLRSPFFSLEPPWFDYHVPEDNDTKENR